MKSEEQNQISEQPSKIMPAEIRAAILKQIGPIEGWLSEAEADLLITAATHAANMAALNPEAAIVEIGSYCGKSTIVLSRTVLSLGEPTPRIHAIDPHAGNLSAIGGGPEQVLPTFDQFQRNLREAGVTEIVETIRSRSVDVPWDKPISFLFVDALHDYASVAADFNHFAPYLLPGALVGFHDCGYHFPGVIRFVREVLGRKEFRLVTRAEFLALVAKTEG